MVNEIQCGCTGIRSCAVCAKNNVHENHQLTTETYWFCPTCTKIYQGNIAEFLAGFFCLDWCEKHSGHSSSLQVEGISVTERFIDEQEENYLIQEINKDEWKLSQSGRRKQDFGPKANFKRRKVKLGAFTGLPSYSKFLVDRMKSLQHDWLSNFHPVELCNLEYTKERGSSIDPHIDDVWLWGDVLVTVNMNSNTILTLRQDTNLKHVERQSEAMETENTHNDRIDSTNTHTTGGNRSEKDSENGLKAEFKGTNQHKTDGRNTETNKSNSNDFFTFGRCEQQNSKHCDVPLLEIQIPMPKQSLLLLSKEARYNWQHSIKTTHIYTCRYAMTLRNLSAEFSEGGTQYEMGNKLIELAYTYNGSTTT